MAEHRELDCLSPCVILAAGWRRKLRLLESATASAAQADIPREHLHDPRIYLFEQKLLLDHVIQSLARELVALDTQLRDALTRNEHQRAGIARHLERSKLSPAAANTEAKRLTELSDNLLCDRDRCRHLLQLMRDNPEIALPSLPLPRYAELLREQRPQLFQRAGTFRLLSALPEIFRPLLKFWDRRDASDRVAIVTAILLCLFVLCFGVYYLFLKERIHVRAYPISQGHYRILFQNLSRSPVLLHAPFLEQEKTEQYLVEYGLTLEAQVKGKHSYAPFHRVTGWTYKDMPAHLAGPIVVSPGLFVEIRLSLEESALPADIQSIRLVCVRAPRTYLVRFPLELPSGRN